MYNHIYFNSMPSGHMILLMNILGQIDGCEHEFSTFWNEEKLKIQTNFLIRNLNNLSEQPNEHDKSDRQNV